LCNRFHSLFSFVKLTSTKNGGNGMQSFSYIIYVCLTDENDRFLPPPSFLGKMGLI